GFSRDWSSDVCSSDLVRCAYDASMVYLAVDVVDDRVVRTRRADPSGEDSVTVSLRASTTAAPLELRVFPQSPGGKRVLVGVPPGAAVEDTLTRRGYAVEIGLPLDRLTGYGRSTPMLLADIVSHDADADGAGPVPTPAGLRGRLVFSAHQPAFRGFPAATRRSRGALRLDERRERDPAAGTQRLARAAPFRGA